MPKVLTRLSSSLPGTCQVCGQWPAKPICQTCMQRFAGHQPRCMTCAIPLTREGHVCGACQTRTTPSPLEYCVAAVSYAFPWDELIARFKFRGEAGWAGPMASMMLSAPRTMPLIEQTGLMVPIPLNPHRLASRGYNQAWELVKALTRRCACDNITPPATLPDALVRTGETPDQHSLPRAQRMQNLKGAFLVHPARAASIIGQQVLLVDDVSTTGSTLELAAQALLETGAAGVSALVFARTPSD